MRVAITGASGFIGRPLSEYLRAEGHHVVSIGRSTPGKRQPDVGWNPDDGWIDRSALGTPEAIINLAGENLAQRWTTDVKREIRESRVRGTDLIARVSASLDPRPAVLVSGSAIGIYGDRGDETLTESSGPGTGFLADTGRAWEDAADPAREAGIRVIHARTGVVINREGGALDRMLPFFSLGLGGRVGSGRQWMSWIALTDVVRALGFLMSSPHLEGPVNLTAPEPVRNSEFTRELAGALKRPALAVVPAFGIRFLYGEMGMETVVAGQRVLPQVLTREGFAFRYPRLGEALRHEL